MSELLERAFGALGPAPTVRELELVAETLRESGDEEVLAMFEAVSDGGVIDDAAFEALVAVAETADAGAFTALDLLTEFHNPGGYAAMGLTRARGIERS